MPNCNKPKLSRRRRLNGERPPFTECLPALVEIRDSGPRKEEAWEFVLQYARSGLSFWDRQGVGPVYEHQKKAVLTDGNVEDALQDVCIRIAEKLADGTFPLHSEAQVRAYLRRAQRHQRLNLMRPWRRWSSLDDNIGGCSQPELNHAGRSYLAELLENVADFAARSERDRATWRLCEEFFFRDTDMAGMLEREEDVSRGPDRSRWNTLRNQYQQRMKRFRDRMEACLPEMAAAGLLTREQQEHAAAAVRRMQRRRTRRS
jgi:hypothetical protein